jgi:hypothetical protein
VADNVDLDTPASPGAKAATIEISHSGDTAQLQLIGLKGVSGTEGAYTVANINGDATNGLDVDVTRVIPGTTASALGKAEDAAHSTGDVGVMALSVRSDTAGATSGTDGDYQPLITDSSGRLHVNVGNTVTVGSHAVTNAGTFATQVDGAALTALQLIDDVVYAEDAAAQAADKGVAVLAVRRDANTSLVGADNDYANLQVDATGSLKVAIISGGGSGGTSTADDADFTAGTTAGTIVQGVYESTPTSVTDGDVGAVGITQTRAMRVAIDSGGVSGRAEDSAHSTGHEGVVVLAVRRDAAAVGSDTDGDYSTINVDASGRVWTNVGNTVTVASHAVTNAGTFAVQVDGAALTALQLIDDAIVADDAAFTPATTKVMMAGFEADETATDSVDEGDAGAARMTLDRKQIVTLQGHTAGGLSIFRSLDIDETEEEVKATAGVLYFIHAMNMVATARYLKFYNATTANVTVGTTTPVLTFPIPANSTTGAGFTVSIPQGLTFGTAITVACTTGVADNDTGAPGANDVIINIGYM